MTDSVFRGCNLLSLLRNARILYKNDPFLSLFVVMIICNLYASRHKQILILWQRWMGTTKRGKVACQKNLVRHGMRACANGVTTEMHREPFFKGT